MTETYDLDLDLDLYYDPHKKSWRYMYSKVPPSKG